MKKLIIAAFLVVIAADISAENADSLVNVANRYYVNNDFQQAADTYKKIIEAGFTSPELYYNLGNAYYKLNKYAYAILNYERALLLKPNDRDIQHNLEIANAHTIDKIDVIPEFFLKRWIVSLINLQSSNNWAMVSIITALCFSVFFLIYLLSGKMFIKQLSFYLFVLLFFISVSSFYFSSQRKKFYIHRNEAVVVAPSVTAKSSPDEYGTDLFILHEGTKVKITDHIGEWKEVRISNGNKAWIEASAIEKI